jgi:hypothetical protein
MFKKTCITLLITFSLLLCQSDLFGQTATGAVNGTVTDPSGAVVAQATVTLTNQKTNIVRQAVTNDSGFFLFINAKCASWGGGSHRGNGSPGTSAIGGQYHD